MTHEKSKTENLKTIESLLPSLSSKEKLNLFTEFAKAGKSRSSTVVNNFATDFTKSINESLKRSSDASKLSLDVASTKKKRIVSSVTSHQISKQEIIDLTLLDDDLESHTNLMATSFTKIEPNLKNDVSAVKTESCESDSGSESESLLTSDHLLEYIYKTRSERLRTNDAVAKVAKGTVKSSAEKELNESMTDTIDQYFDDERNIDSNKSDDNESIDEQANSQLKNVRVNSKSIAKHSPSDHADFADVDLIKIKHDIFNDKPESYDCNDLLDATLFPSFGGKLKPKFIKFDGNVFPPYPKTHPEGIAHVIELPPEILSDKKKVNQFRTALQYSMTKGHGIKTRHNAEFFSIDGEDVPMNYFYRQCNGVKACEFLPEEHRHHTDVNEAEGHPWARLLAAQEQATETQNSIQAELVFYTANKNVLCDRYCTANNGPCGGRAVVRAFKSGNNWERLFIGCERYRQREAGHTFIPLRNHNPIGVLKLWGKEHCWVPNEVLTSLNFDWDDEHNDSHSTKVVCYAVYANLQGPRDNFCPFYHEVDAKFHIFMPKFAHGQPSTNKMVIIAVGIHDHPPPPPIKIDDNARIDVTDMCHKLSLQDLTARKFLSSPLLPILLNGSTHLSERRLGSINYDTLSHLIRKEKLREFPFGTDILGVQHLMQSCISDPYIRRAIQSSDGHFVVLCQFEAQSNMYYNTIEIQADKTFRRTKIQEYEINAYDPVSHRIATLARVFTDYEDEEGYFQAVDLSWSVAEEDIGRRIPWAHLSDTHDNTIRHSTTHIKAILLDLHSGQLKGIGRYFQKEYPTKGDGTANWHTSRIVKLCQVHYERSIRKLEVKGLSEDICRDLRIIPEVQSEGAFRGIMTRVREHALLPVPCKKQLSDWIKHKDDNPWIFQGLCFPLSNMSHENWFTTRFNTNVAEGAHAMSQRSGKHLSLVGAIMAGERLDAQFLESCRTVLQFGVSTNYGNKSITGRTQKNMIRNNKRPAKRREGKKKADESVEKTVAAATDLLMDRLMNSGDLERVLGSHNKA